MVDFVIDMYDQESTTFDKQSGNAGPLTRKEVTETYEFFRTCPDCKEKKQMETWSEAFGFEPETDKEKANRLLFFCERAYRREMIVKELSVLNIAYQMLSTDGTMESGKAIFDSFEPSLQSVYTKMGAKVVKHLNDAFFKV